MGIVENPENMLDVSLMESIPEFSTDDAEFILDVVDQNLAFIDGTNEGKKKIVHRYETVIVEELRKQIYASKEESTEFVFNVQKELIVFGTFVKNIKENRRLNLKKKCQTRKISCSIYLKATRNHIMQEMHLIVMIINI